MENLTTLTGFFGWTAIINLAIYLVTALALAVFKDSIKQLHAQLTGVAVDQLDSLYFQYLAQYKLAIVIFSLTPYLALKLMAG
ncbi:hypothetical protein SIN8267_02495 [Sinobacterium norvegicum]|uniref:DUF6868 domain-containing protein n=1 Tax=Sinobacterium norvegicum TaxID=1641715 RepID=A0ABM9AGN8_9GAMM|nr:hypothetical protein [Sinobacterium norvegicum]CAH0992376.1 hypothetical protein SIN8267_02495 [Sinobacterium norvegicum]